MNSALLSNGAPETNFNMYLQSNSSEDNRQAEPNLQNGNSIMASATKKDSDLFEGQLNQ